MERAERLVGTELEILGVVLPDVVADDVLEIALLGVDVVNTLVDVLLVLDLDVVSNEVLLSLGGDDALDSVLLVLDVDDTLDDILLVLDADTVEDLVRALLVVDARLLVLFDAKIDLQAFSTCAALRSGIVDSDLGLPVHISIQPVKVSTLLLQLTMQCKRCKTTCSHCKCFLQS